ncbi:MAG: hypothetical protein ACTSP0_03730 [Alphaproteobacteria bacterium]
MIRKALLTATLAMFMAGPAFAGQCPNDMAAIDAALPKAKLNDANKTLVMDLRAKGGMQHKSGNHPASVKTLAQAKKILGL